MKPLVPILSLSLCAAVASAQPDVYAVDNSGVIYLIDVDLGTRTVLVDLVGVGLPESLAVTEDNQTLYLINSVGELYTIDLGTLTIVAASDLGTGNIEALDVVDGQLLAVGFGSVPQLYKIDPVSGDAVSLGSTLTSIPASARSLAMSSPTVGFAASSSGLYEVNFASRAVTAVTTYSQPDTFFCMDFVGDRLIALGSTSGTVYDIDPLTGNPTPLAGSLPGSFYLGMAAVPEVTDQFLQGELVESSPRWDRPKDSGFIPGPCGGSVALDSYNNSQPFLQYTLTPINPAEPVTVVMESLEPTLADFDPFLAIYCEPFKPFFPLDNATALDDDSGFDGDDLTRQNARLELMLDPGQSHTLVATSYASWAPARFGRFQLTISNAKAEFACLADLNGDGVLDQGDIQDFVKLFVLVDPAADFNGDTIIDLGDIQAFIAFFLAGC